MRVRSHIPPLLGIAMFFILVLSIPCRLLAQNNETISGVVDDESNRAPLAGVNILVKGTARGGSTDASGKYSISAKKNDVLVFSIVGYEDQEIIVGDNSTVNVSLKKGETVLQGVVVDVGYGTIKKRNITGAVASLSARNLKDRPVANFGAAMIGQVAGVQVQQISGAPGDEGLSVRVRGAGSITQSNDPLYVVDGYPMEGSVFRLLNNSDIESIEILKDASSTAIYGSRGANGVILITTKKGRGPAAVSFNMYTGIQQLERKIEMMNRDQYVQYFVDARNQAWLDIPVIASDPDQTPHTINDPNTRRVRYPGAAGQYLIPDGTGNFKYNFLDPASVAQMPDNDWQDLLFRNAQMQQYEVSVNGGSEKTNYSFSSSYLKQQGIVLNSDYKRFNFRTSVSTKINDRIEAGMTLSAYFSSGNEVPEGRYSPMSFAINLPPVFPVNNPDGTFGSMVRNPDIIAGEHINPIGHATQNYNFRKRNGYIGTFFGTWEIIDNLKYKASINGGIQSNIFKTYVPSYIDLVASPAPRPADASSQSVTDHDWVIEQTLTYSKTVADKHNLMGVIGYTSQQHTFENLMGTARGFPNDNIYTLNAGTMRSLTSTESEYAMISYLARVNYSYDDRYLLTATIRRDGSSRFGRDRKWGNFPSMSVGWRVSQEKFMQGIEAISDFKIRASYGIAGNNRIGDYASIGLLATGLYPTGNATQITVDPSTLSNYELGWEKTRQFNLGFDLSVIKNRVRLSVDVYNTQSIDLLLDAPVPSITGFTTLMQNVGKVQNKGVEFQLSTDNLVSDFKWSTDFNIAFNKNKVLEVANDRVIYAGVSGSGNTFITRRGDPIASFFGYVYQGVFMSQAELDQYPHLPSDKVGDGRYQDTNKDGVIDDRDKVIIGNNHPDFIAGMSNNFSYKNFSLGIQLTASYGAKLFSFFERMVGTFNGSRNGMIQQLERWRSPSEPGGGYYFRPTANPTGLQLTPSSAWVTDASYLRIQNVTFGYTFADGLLKNIGINNLRVYVAAQNLLTITNYPGYDPATSSEGSGLAKGGDFSGYPVARSIILGVNVRF